MAACDVNMTTTPTFNLNEVCDGPVLTENTTSSTFSAHSAESFPEVKIAETLWRVVPPFILLFGTVGNAMTLAVMRAMTSRRSQGQGQSDGSMAVYFTTLALCDLSVLWIGLTRLWSKAVFQYDVRLVSDVMCKLHKFLVYTLGRVTTWILVAVTSQRVMSVMMPLRHELRGTRKRALVVVSVIVFACAVTDLGHLVTRTVVRSSSGKVKCTYSRESKMSVFYNEEVYPWINIFLGSLLPLTILVVNNVLLARTVHQAVKTSRKMTASSASQEGARKRKTSSLSVTLVITSVAFVLLTSSVPAGFFFRRYFLPTLPPGPGLDAVLGLAEAVLDLLWYCNSAVNFYLYCLSGTKFRQYARRLVQCEGNDAQVTSLSAPTRSVKTVSEQVSSSSCNTGEENENKV